MALLNAVKFWVDGMLRANVNIASWACFPDSVKTNPRRSNACSKKCQSNTKKGREGSREEQQIGLLGMEAIRVNEASFCNSYELCLAVF